MHQTMLIYGVTFEGQTDAELKRKSVASKQYAGTDLQDQLDAALDAIKAGRKAGTAVQDPDPTAEASAYAGNTSPGS